MSQLLDVRNLQKHYRDVKAVDGINFSIAQGRCFGLLGPNGAGKTTTIEILEGITSPTRGKILYRGNAIGPSFRDEAGIMFQTTALQDYITVHESLELFQNFYPKSFSLDDLIERCNLGDFLKRDCRKLSGGQRQRLLLAIALINDPEILFLDEPTTGLDPQSRRNFWSLVEDIKAAGKTLLLTTHYMEEAYALCDEIAIMDHGKIVAQGSPDTLLKEYFNESIITLPAYDVPASMDEKLSLQRRNNHVEILSDDVNCTIWQLLNDDVSLNNIQVRTPNLEDLFLKLTGHELRQ
ncbi:MAG: ABC transporter ATP-binding protein [Gammaproteobacteria bacterium]|nr:ABC transporter ATP-binding protein [Gammaproteobacteria bacterium]